MTKEELLEKLKEYASQGYSEEMGHRHADRALLEYINDPEITAAFNPDDEWWYA